jgi:hypothetical protein
MIIKYRTGDWRGVKKLYKNFINIVLYRYLFLNIQIEEERRREEKIGKVGFG